MPLAAPTSLLRYMESLFCHHNCLLGDIAEAGGVLADVWGRTVSWFRRLSPSKFRYLVAAVLLQIEERDPFVVGRSLQDIRMA